MHTENTCTTHTLFGRPYNPKEHIPPHSANSTTNNKHTQNIANCFIKHFTNTVRHATHKTYRCTDILKQKIQGYKITLTTTKVQEVIKQSKNNNLRGPEKLNSRHVKHIGLAFSMSMFEVALTNNIIPHILKVANLVPIPKPNKDINKDTSYKPISLSAIADTG